EGYNPITLVRRYVHVSPTRHSATTPARPPTPPPGPRRLRPALTLPRLSAGPRRPSDIVRRPCSFLGLGRHPAVGRFPSEDGGNGAFAAALRGVARKIVHNWASCATWCAAH